MTTAAEEKIRAFCAHHRLKCEWQDLTNLGERAVVKTLNRAHHTKILKEKELCAGGEEDLVEASAANISFAGGDLHGTSQTVWYASVKDSDNNIPRATMLKLSVPISYSLGTLDYTLNSIESTLWNGK